MALILRRQRDHYNDPKYSDDMYVALSGEMIVGTIYKTSGGAQGEGWGWWINGVHFSPSIAAARGFTPSLEEAKTELATNWRKWLAFAGLTEK